MKYRPIYMPAHRGRNKKTPLFNSNAEAWEWIEERSKKCPILHSGKVCESCCAEWTVDIIK